MTSARKKVCFAAVLAGAGVLALLSLLTWSQSPVFRTVPAANAQNESYSVKMSPMGEVRFRHVPRRIVTLDANYNDMLVALGNGADIVATGFRPNFYEGFYAQLNGLQTNMDPSRLAYLSTGTGGLIDKELLYALHGDVHHIDPLQLAASRGWSDADVQEIARNVGPFFANRYSRENNYTGHAPYEYYSLFDLSKKVGEVYRRADTIARLESVYQELRRKIQAKLPPVERRPRIGLVYYASGRFTPYGLGHGGFGQAQYRDVGARDAFQAIEAQTYGGGGSPGGTLDKEGLLAIDPDILIVPFAIYPVRAGGGTSRVNYEQLLTLRDDPLLRRMTAFRTGRIFPGGTPLQGPIFYLFQIEMAAKQIYPAIFGPYRDDQNYSPQEQLFDRRQVARILEASESESRGQP